MLYRVELCATEIQVETNDEDQAHRNAREDAAEFYGDWNYTVDDVDPVDLSQEDEEVVPTASVDDMNVSVDLTDQDGGLFTFDGYFTVIVEAVDEDEAKVKALALPKELRYGNTPAPTL